VCCTLGVAGTVGCNTIFTVTAEASECTFLVATASTVGGGFIAVFDAIETGHTHVTDATATLTIGISFATAGGRNTRRSTGLAISTTINRCFVAAFYTIVTRYTYVVETIASLAIIVVHAGIGV
jgi:hypothetical protein